MKTIYNLNENNLNLFFPVIEIGYTLYGKLFIQRQRGSNCL
jgi:hypothetical protein